MGWLVWLMIIQVIGVRTITILRDITFTHYLKKNRYREIKLPLMVKISNNIIGTLQSAIPFYGAFLILVGLFSSDELILKVCIDKKLVEECV